MGVAAKNLFEHIDTFMDYRKTVYEVSDQTIKSTRTDLRLFENFIDNKHHIIIDGHAVMEFQYYLKKGRKNSG